VPVALLRLLQCRPISIPWNSISLATKQPFRKQLTRVQIGSTQVTGPSWCFAMLTNTNNPDRPD
jgi:hypothetical protein